MTMAALRFCARCKGNLVEAHGELACIACGWEPNAPTAGVAIEDAASLGQGAIEKLRELSSRIEEHKEEIATANANIAKVKAEAGRFIQIAELCGVEAPPQLLQRFGRAKRPQKRNGGGHHADGTGLSCPEAGCDVVVNGPQGLAVHRAKAHGIAGTSRRRPE